MALAGVCFTTTFISIVGTLGTASLSVGFGAYDQRADIDWIWIVELRRRATLEEIAELCTPKRQTHNNWEGDWR